MLLAIQLLCLMAAYYLGRHDAPACDNFTIYGSSPREQERFHNSNFAIKAVICALACSSLALSSVIWVGLICVVPCTFILWTTFNISLNLNRKIERKWWYISKSSNKTDRWLYEWFGERSGVILAAASVLIIAGVNILIIAVYGQTYPDLTRLVPVYQG